MGKNRTLQEILLSYYEEKKRNSPGAYSLRSYAKLLGVSPGRLNSIINKKNIPTKTTVDKMVRALKLSDTEVKEFQNAVARDKKNRLLETADVVIEEEDLHVVVDWVPYAIISLLMTVNFVLSAENVAARLNISLKKATESIEKLKSLRLIVERDDGWKASQSKLATVTDIPSQMIRKSHEDKMALALRRLHDVDVNLRDFSSITFPIDLENIELAKKMIISFRRDLAEAMSLGRPSEVYALNVQLFPISSFKAGLE